MATEVSAPVRNESVSAGERRVRRKARRLDLGQCADAFQQSVIKCLCLRLGMLVLSEVERGQNHPPGIEAGFDALQFLEAAQAKPGTHQPVRPNLRFVGRAWHNR